MIDKPGSPTAGLTRLDGHQPLGNTFLTGCASIGCGAPIAVIGAVIIGYATQSTSGGSSLNAVILGLCVLAAGGWPAVTGIARTVRNSRMSDRLYVNPHEPWLAYTYWNRDGTARALQMHQGSWALGFLLWLVGGAVINVFASAPIVIGIIAAPLCTLSLVGGVRRIIHDRRRGRLTMRFEPFPIRPGDAFMATLQHQRPPRFVDRAVLTFRSVAEKHDPDPPPRGGATACFEGHRELMELHSASVAHGEPLTLSAAFTAPPDAASNELTADHPHYWEIEVDLQGGRRRYRGRFLVPLFGPQSVSEEDAADCGPR